MLQKFRVKTVKTGGGKLRRETPVYIKKVERLLDTVEKASSLPEITDLLDGVLVLTREMTGASASSLLMVDEEKQRLRSLVTESEAGKKVREIDLAPDKGICAWVVRHAKAVILNAVHEDARFDRSIDEIAGFRTVSMIAVPFLRSGKVIGLLEVINKTGDGGFNEKDFAALRDFSSSRAFILLVSMMLTIINNVRAHQIMIDWYKSMFETLIGAIDAKDPFSYGHSSRVKELSLKMARAFGLPSDELQVIELGALLHDIGKADIHDLVLRKAGPLTDTEMYTMRKHTRRGKHMLIEIPFLEKVREVILYHHERYDGKGYPDGIKGKSIPLPARIVAVAEAYDAMTTDRSYRKKMNVEDAVKEIQKGSGTQFCPAVVKKFTEVVDHTEPLPLEPADGTSGHDAADGFAPPIPFGAANHEVQLMVRTLDDTDALRKFRKALEQMDELKVVMENYSEEDGATFVIKVRSGLDLPGLLGKIPQVCGVEASGEHLMVTVQTPASQKVFKQGFNLEYQA